MRNLQTRKTRASGPNPREDLPSTTNLPTTAKLFLINAGILWFTLDGAVDKLIVCDGAANPVSAVCHVVVRSMGTSGDPLSTTRSCQHGRLRDTISDTQ